MDSAREPLPAFVDPSFIEVPFEVAVLGSSRTRSSFVAHELDHDDVMDALLDSGTTQDALAGPSSAQDKREARAAAKLAAKQSSEAERLAAVQAKAAEKQAKLDAKAEAKRARRGAGASEVMAEVRAEDSLDETVEVLPVAETKTETATERALSSEEIPEKKTALSFDELMGGSSS